MAIIPETEFPGKIIPGNASYPYGQARDITTPSDGTGTPLRASLVNDIFGFQQALLAAAGVTPSGAPDTALASQYLEALQTVASGAAKLIAVGYNQDWQQFTPGVNRSIGSEYTNLSNRVIVVSASVRVGTYQSSELRVDGKVLGSIYGDVGGGGSVQGQLYGHVPPGKKYRIDGGSLISWAELK